MSRSNGPSDIWMRKMKALFECFDNDHNGFIEEADCQRQVERMRKHGNLPCEKSKQLEKVITDWWEYLLKDGEKISFEQFMKARYEVPKSEEQDKFFKKNLEIMFHAIDANDDGVISLEEFKGYHLSMGIEDSKCTERVFRVIDLNNDGEIDFEEFSKAAFDFTYNQEDSIYKEFYGPLPSNK